MTNLEKKNLLLNLLNERTARENTYYEILENMGDLKKDYHTYMITAPVDVEIELKRLEEADYNLCGALLTMLLREDHFCNGSFERRYNNGQVTLIVERMIELL